jgi:hypothetical protein
MAPEPRTKGTVPRRPGRPKLGLGDRNIPFTQT